MLKTIVVALSLLVGPATCGQVRSPSENRLVLADFGKGFRLDRVSTSGTAEVSLTRAAAAPALLIRTTKADAAIRVAAERPWDFSSRLYVRMDVFNSGSAEVLAVALVNGNPEMAGAQVVPAGLHRTLTALIRRSVRPDSVARVLFGMDGLPGGYVAAFQAKDPRQIDFIEIRLPHVPAGATLEIASLRAEGVYETPSWEPSRFPILDEFFQLRDRDWPGKMHSLTELRQSIAVEDLDLNSNAGPPRWNQFGGWADGPTLAATGHFRVEKYEGKWWFVDPSGKLFWSHGVDAVRPNAPTPVTDRERYFARLPEKPSPFYAEGGGAAREYYKDRSYTTFDVLAANLEKKYQSPWLDVWAERSHKRLRSWGLNTLGAWSDDAVLSKRRTPYVVYLHSGGPAIQGAEGYWFNFPDPFDDGFRAGIGRLRSYGLGKIVTEPLAFEKGRTSDDPWCIGYFVDNEAVWGDDAFLAIGVLRSPPAQAAKHEFLTDLQKKYGSVAELNGSWGLHLNSWEDFLESRAVPATEASKADLQAFTKKIAARYFSSIRDRIREVAPSKLYLGARFGLPLYPDISDRENWLMPIAAQYCDVVSFNRYRYTTRELQLPEGLDRPILIGEFHFGALDRGMLHPGLLFADDQKQRATFYEYYVEQALRNPAIVGTHWYLMNDEPTTGRRDGENYQVGFLDVCDNPYKEMIEATRFIGHRLYELRSRSAAIH